MLSFSNFIPAVVAQCYSPVHFIKLQMSSVGFQSIDTLLFMTHFTWSKCCQGSSLVPSGLPHSFASPGQARSCHPSWEGELNVSRSEAWEEEGGSPSKLEVGVVWEELSSVPLIAILYWQWCWCWSVAYTDNLGSSTMPWDKYMKRWYTVCLYTCSWSQVIAS